MEDRRSDNLLPHGGAEKTLKSDEAIKPSDSFCGKLPSEARRQTMQKAKLTDQSLIEIRRMEQKRHKKRQYELGTENANVDGEMGDTVTTEQVSSIASKSSDMVVTKENMTVSEQNVQERKQSPYRMALEIFNVYDFVCLEGQLYLYFDNEGFWKLIPESEANREMRAIIPEDMRNKVNKVSLYEMYEWIRELALSVDEYMPDKRYCINFADCAFNWKEGQIIKHR